MQAEVRKVIGGPHFLKGLLGRGVEVRELLWLIREEPWQFYLEAEGDGVRVYAWDRSCAYGFVNPLGLSEPLCGEASVIGRERVELFSLGRWPGENGGPEAIAGELRRLAETLSERVAIAFSGGLDSSLLAAAFKGSVLINVSRDGSADRESARDSAKALGLDVEFIEPNMKGIEAALKLYRSPMDISLFVGFYTVSKRAHELGIRYVLAGQMADELFGGYRRHQGIPIEALSEVLNRDFIMGRVGLMRDSRAIVEGGCEALFPYAAGLIPGLAMSMKPELRANKEALREAAAIMGLPEAIARRKKKAFQYGSGIERLVRSYIKGITGT